MSNYEQQVIGLLTELINISDNSEQLRLIGSSLENIEELLQKLIDEK